MQSAAFEATFPIMGGLVWNRTFHAMYATPIQPRDVALGNLLWVMLRLTLIATVFTSVIILFGAAHSPTIVLAIGAAVLTGMAFAGPIAAFSATQRTPEKFNAVFRFVITPLFLFSGVFFPIDTLPPFLQPFAWLSPLWHGVSLTRALALGYAAEEPLLVLVHVVVLTTIAVVGAWAAVQTVTKKLVRG
jgi:lipooligosaccharide transport system permease protein